MNVMALVLYFGATTLTMM